VTLTWTAVTGATSYNIYWSTLPDVTKTIGAATIGLLPTPPPLTTAVTLANGTTYYFVVTAVNANGESMESNELSATPTP
jgi:fibronectin type 3 domain-containing protein